jgi:hypothetical protein
MWGFVLVELDAKANSLAGSRNGAHVNRGLAIGCRCLLRQPYAQELEPCCNGLSDRMCSWVAGRLHEASINLERARTKLAYSCKGRVSGSKVINRELESSIGQEPYTFAEIFAVA